MNIEPEQIINLVIKHPSGKIKHMPVIIIETGNIDSGWSTAPFIVVQPNVMTGPELKQWRIDLKLTQRKASKLHDISLHTWQSYEQGRRVIPHELREVLK